MKKTFRILFTFTVLLTIFVSCQPKANEVALPETNQKSSLTSHPTDASAISGTVSLTVTATTSRIINPGGVFNHQIKLMDGTKPIANATVLINDPIGLVCTWVKTNSQGIANWSRSTSSLTKRQLYTFYFSYGNYNAFSTVAVASSSTATRLSNLKVSIDGSPIISLPTMVLGSRFGVLPIYQGLDNTMQVALDLGKDIATDYLSNPANITIVTVAAVSCTAGLTIPVAGEAACATSVNMIRSGLTETAVKQIGLRAINASKTMSPSQKQVYRNIIEVGSCAYALAKFKPGEGLQSVENLATLYDVKTTITPFFIQKNGVAKGMSIPFVDPTTNTTYMFSFVKR
ncbi:MAG: hypothetical protein JNL70_12165 [Saprospiraceae bacterium]|nr:hypothetical protein [Saprospiraceae bacterium]